MKRRLSIRWVLTLTMVGLTLTAMLVVSSVYTATATTMFNQLGMSSMLQPTLKQRKTSMPATSCWARACLRRERMASLR